MKNEFRIWDVQKQRFVGNLDNFAIDCEGIVLKFHRHSKKDDAYVIEGNFSGSKDDYIAQRFTGLFDKKKKKIFEGDIVSFKGSFKEYPWRVIWDAADAGFKLADSGDDAYWLKLSEVEGIQVIGHRNKH